MVTTLEGRIVRPLNNDAINNVEVDLSNDSDGIYCLKITTCNNIREEKIIKIIFVVKEASYGSVRCFFVINLFNPWLTDFVLIQQLMVLYL